MPRQPMIGKVGGGVRAGRRPPMIGGGTAGRMPDPFMEEWNRIVQMTGMPPVTRGFQPMWGFDEGGNKRTGPGAMGASSERGTWIAPERRSKWKERYDTREEFREYHRKDPRVAWT